MVRRKEIEWEEREMVGMAVGGGVKRDRVGSEIPRRSRPWWETVNRLKITEIFLSLQGESSLVGLPTVFVRLTGCPLRCVYCDTQYAYDGGERMEISQIVEKVKGYGVPYVCVTGGEPLAQKGSLELLRRLCEEGFTVSLETSGALDISRVDPRVIKVLDLKTPSSGECHRNRYQNIDLLSSRDQVKIVIGNREDYLWAKEILRRYRLPERVEVLFSPVWGQLPPRTMAEWILEDRLPVRFQIQLHKVLWGEERGR